MTSGRRIIVALLLAGAGLVFIAPGAGAHALLRASDPADGETLFESPDAVTLTFTEDPEITLTNVRVLDASGGSHEVGKPSRVPMQARTVRVRVKELSKGVYTVAWRVVSRVDGHATGGAFAFGLGVSPSDQPKTNVSTPVTPPISPAEVAGRWLLYLGLLGLLGAAWVSAFAFSSIPPSIRRFMAVGWVTSLAGLLLLGLTQRAAAGASFGDLLSTPIGRALMWRAAAIGSAGLALLGSTRLKERASR
ncbi:MAG: copper resistance CopC family protein, partial [Actinomycetota bacterium]